MKYLGMLCGVVWVWLTFKGSFWLEAWSLRGCSWKVWNLYKVGVNGGTVVWNKNVK